MARYDDYYNYTGYFFISTSFKIKKIAIIKKARERS